MFYGLNKFIKNLLPKGLFYRALLIVAIPVIVLQIIITFVFFDSLWIKTNKGMTRALANEINTFIEVYNDEMYKKDEITNLFSVYQDLNIEFVEDENYNYDYDERWFSPIDRTLRRELKSRFGSGQFWFDTTSYKELIDLRVKYQSGYFKFLVPKDRVTSSSARIFALWITVPALIMVLISLIFLKNQTRPITNLAKAAEKFGKGEEIEEFKPSGAAEIRQAGYEFDKMRKRIIRHLNQRSEMLSGISHDLRLKPDMNASRSFFSFFVGVLNNFLKIDFFLAGDITELVCFDEDANGAVALLLSLKFSPAVCATAVTGTTTAAPSFAADLILVSFRPANPVTDFRADHAKLPFNCPTSSLHLPSNDSQV